MASKRTDFILPNSVIGPAEVARAKRELEALDERLRQAELRAKSAGKKATEAADAKGQLKAIADANECDLDVKKQRQELLASLTELVETAPTVTISFAVDPSDAFMAKLVEWFRTNTHPSVLIRVGLQPSITAGCRLHTPGKLYDFSLRNRFNEQRPLLVKRLKESARPAEVSIKAPTVEAPA